MIGGRNMKIVAVIPAYNEESSICDVIARAKIHTDEVVVIDDGSKDSTASLAEHMGAKVLRHQRNYGKGASLHTAFKWAVENHVSILVTLDADGQHDPGEIPMVTDPILSGQAGMVIGARFLGEHNTVVPMYRRIGQEILTFATNLASGLRLNDSQSGFRAFSSESFKVFKFHSKGMGIESEMIIAAASAGIRILEVPVTCRYDVGGGNIPGAFKHGFSVLYSIVRYFLTTRLQFLKSSSFIFLQKEDELCL